MEADEQMLRDQRGKDAHLNRFPFRHSADLFLAPEIRRLRQHGTMNRTWN